MGNKDTFINQFFLITVYFYMPDLLFFYSTFEMKLLQGFKMIKRNGIPLIYSIKQFIFGLGIKPDLGICL